jgi:hypothetical protein
MNRFFSSGYFQLLCLAFFTVLFLIVKDDPFFGDAIASTSRCVNTIYDHHLATIFYPAEADPAHPTLYPWLLALLWTAFGKSLPVSHLYAVLWLVCLTLIFRKIARLVLYDNAAVNKATLLLLTMPVFLAQGAMMLNTVAEMTFFLCAVYGLLSGSRKWFLSGAIFMMIAHLQGSFFLLALASADLFFALKEKKPVLTFFRERFLYYFIPLLVFAVWLLLHSRHTGWLVQSPNYSDADELNGPLQFGKSLLIMVWRLVDFGMLPFYLVFIYALFNKVGDKKVQQSWLIFTGVSCAFMAVFLSKTIGHRYFLALGMLMIVLVMNILQHIRPRQRNVLYAVLFFSLLAGNFLYYPGKNLGDGTLAYRSYFTIAKEIKKDFGDTVCFYSYAPVANPPELTYLDHSGLKTRRIGNLVLDSLPAIIQSNVNAEFTERDKQFLEHHFYGKSYEKGVVYVNVFLNPAYYAKPTGWKLRDPSAVEKWMIGLKERMKE